MALHTPDLHFWKSEIFLMRWVDTISENQPVGQITWQAGRAPARGFAGYFDLGA
jgi:hypothetical protein